MINMVLFGPPGAGKGTQATILKEKYGLVHISTGDVFRANIKSQTSLGVLAKSYIDQGKLVTDRVTIEMLQSEVQQNPKAKGFIFDGFPRTISQAQALDLFLKEQGMCINGMIALEVSEDLLVERLLARGKESGRSDDQDEEKIRNRFEEYRHKTAPVKSYYQAQQKYYGIDGVGSIDLIATKISDTVELW